MEITMRSNYYIGWLVSVSVLAIVGLFMLF